MFINHVVIILLQRLKGGWQVSEILGKIIVTFMKNVSMVLRLSKVIIYPLKDALNDTNITKSRQTILEQR